MLTDLYNAVLTIVIGGLLLFGFIWFLVCLMIIFGE